MKVLIVDDEAPARHRLRLALEKESDLIIAGECENGLKALEALAQHHPDLIFLDIQMPGLDGFEFLRALPPEDRPLIIFVTAFNEHAIRAFEVHALDYLLKPFRRERLQESLQRARVLFSHRTEKEVAAKLEALLQTFPQNPGAAHAERLAIKDGTRWSIVPVSEIVVLLASGNYVEVHTLDKRCLLWRETMQHLESRLNPSHFFRASRSTFVNLHFIREIQSEGKSGHTIHMTTGITVHLTAPWETLQAKIASL
jgi:two-component system LytT family response regulator